MPDYTTGWMFLIRGELIRCMNHPGFFSIQQYRFILLFILLILAGFSYNIVIGDQNGDDSTRNSHLFQLNVPDVRQSTDYSCGAGATQAVLRYWGQDIPEEDIIWLLNISEDGMRGADPKYVVNVIKYGYNLEAQMKENMTIADLERSIRDGIPVIVPIQAWKGDDPTPWSEDINHGHYVVVTGFDTDNLYFEDPAILGSAGYIPKDEFVQRWHHVVTNPVLSPDGVRYEHQGIIVKGEQHLEIPKIIRIT